MKKIAILCLIFIIVVAISGCIGSDDSSQTGNDTDDYKLQINTTGNWRLDLTVNDKYSSDTGEGSKTINLGNVKTASVTLNQYSKGPTQVYLLDSNNDIVSQGETTNEGSGTIYFYYSK